MKTETKSNYNTECPGCGSGERERSEHGGYSGFRTCPYCGAEKCCMCDMGDYVECISCDPETNPED